MWTKNYFHYLPICSIQPLLKFLAPSYHWISFELCYSASMISGGTVLFHLYLQAFRKCIQTRTKWAQSMDIRLSPSLSSYLTLSVNEPSVLSKLFGKRWGWVVGVTKCVDRKTLMYWLCYLTFTMLTAWVRCVVCLWCVKTIKQSTIKILFFYTL